MSIHDGHRARKKTQFREFGLDAFSDFEVLELLLYYAVPRRDTSPIAHRLIERFGSISGVLAASPEELEQVEGMGENAATLVSLLLPVCRRAYRSEARETGVILSSTERAGDYFCRIFQGLREEEFYQACLDAKGKLLSCTRIASGGTDSVSINMRSIVKTALQVRASGVILSHNHPSGVALPSGDDNATTLMAYDALRTVGIELIDHIIVADGDFVSLRDNGLLPPR